jgi:DNA polymerase III subunit delta'
MPFSRVIGHENIVALLKRALKADRIAHAYLFHGTEGCGMKQVALTLIEAVFCGSDDGCGTCSSCRKVSGQQHPDLHVLEPDGAFIKIDQIRGLQRELAYRPFEAQKKACIIERAERMNPAAANAFLKTLEEPPGDALLILLTTHAEGILPTILSRCQQLRFAPLPLDTIATQLQESGIAEEQARVAAALAGGSIEQARNLISSDLFASRHTLLEQVASLKESNITALFATAEQYSADKDGAGYLIAMLRLFWRDVLLVKSGCLAITNLDLVPLAQKMAERYTMKQIMEKLEFINRADQALNRNVNPRLTAEVLFMELNDYRRRSSHM